MRMFIIVGSRCIKYIKRKKEMKARINPDDESKQEITVVVDNSQAKVQLFEVQEDGGFDQFNNFH